jgi:hypothetical protein
MNVNAEKMEKQEINLPYEQPILKKYGTMKEFTLNSSGSGGGRSKDNDFGKINDAKLEDDGDATSPDPK